MKANYQRRKTSVVEIGNTPMGGDYPIRIQSMTNTSTLDTEESIEQCIRIIEAGADYVRLTAQGVREAENLKNIKAGLVARGYTTPLIADIHFNPKAAEVAALHVEKVRINPGNFADPVKKFHTFEYTDEEYGLEIQKIKERFIPFLHICRENKTAIRIGVNHGSLSDRIMSRYGDTPQGMVESCMEFLRICVEEDFRNVVISIKASNTSVMVRTVRLLVCKMEEEDMYFPLHLGVTEAGDGEDGRIKSAVGTGALLTEGIGDTIRISLSEDPAKEIPVAKTLVQYINRRKNHPLSGEITDKPFYNRFAPDKRKTFQVKNMGAKEVPVVISDRSCTDDFTLGRSLIPDYLYVGDESPDNFPSGLPIIVNYPFYIPSENAYPLFRISELDKFLDCTASLKFLELELKDLTKETAGLIRKDKQTVLILTTSHVNGAGEQMAAFERMAGYEIENPVIIRRNYKEENNDQFRIKAASDTGIFFIDMLADGIFLSNEGDCPVQHADACSFGILQAAGRRISKTEFISCPGCGRTLFDLQSTIKNVKAETAHLKGLKIGIMGCIVNGPGEMADADYGYVGAGKGKVCLYKGKECLLKNIPEEEAVEKLVGLIKKYGDWKDKN